MSRAASSRLVGALLVAALAACAADVAARSSGLLAPLERASVDMRFSVRGAAKPSAQIAIVGLDYNSVAHLPRFPFTRALHAEVITRLHAAGARVIVYDFAFDRPTTISADDALANAAQAAAPVIFATSEISNGQTEVLGGNSNLESIGARAAAALMPTDPDGVIRHLAASVSELPTIADTTATLLHGARAPTAKQIATSGSWIDFAGGPGTYPVLSFLNVLRGYFNPALVRGKVVIVGATAPSLQDLHSTAAGGGPMSGAEIQANAIATLLDNLPLRNTPTPLNDVLIVLGSLIVCLAAIRLRAVWIVALGGLLCAAWLLACALAFADGRVLSVTPELLALILASAGAASIKSLLSTREQKRLREAFAAMAPDAVEAVLNRRDKHNRLLGKDDIVAGYRIEGLIGRGGMGNVWKATDLRHNRSVALKVIAPTHANDPQFRVRFTDERAVAFSIDHENVVPVYDAGEDRRLLYIAMRLVDGETLQALVQRTGPLDPERTIRIGEQIAAALTAVHERGLVHRDVKPTNILLTSSQPPHAYLADFGIASRAGTRGRFDGTAGYAPPEQLSGSHTDARSDVYALAAVIRYCLTQQAPPHNGPAYLVGDPSQHDATEAVLSAAMAEDPGERPSTPADLVVAVADALGVPTRIAQRPVHANRDRPPAVEDPNATHAAD